MEINIKKNDVLSAKNIEDAGLEPTYQNFAGLDIYKKDEVRYLLEPNKGGFKVFHIYSV
ncbi:MAG: hypothetical protein KKB25_01165 [Nanoarchaeota archaeon]|nr:hypothetical protein [Nanoarchaeota archaeon]